MRYNKRIENEEIVNFEICRKNPVVDLEEFVFYFMILLQVEPMELFHI